MLATKCFEVAGKRIDVAMASAVKQDELLGLLAQRLFVGAGQAKRIGTELSEDIVLLMMVGLPADIKAKVSAILTEKAFVVGANPTPISIEDFNGKIVEWNRLLAKLVLWNLGDFFDLLRSADLDAGAAKAQVTPPAA